jgi:hypothetical protein
MGLMDKIKETAQEVAGEARKATTQGKVKLEGLALRRKMDDAAKQLGYLVFRERTQGTFSGSEADTLIASMRELEDQVARSDLEATPSPGERSSEPEARAEGGGGPIEQTQETAPEGRPTDQAAG